MARRNAGPSRGETRPRPRAWVMGSVVAAASIAGSCRARPVADPQDPSASAPVVWTECTLAPTEVCTREHLDLERCALSCRAGDTTSCVATLEHGGDPGPEGREVLEAACTRDPVCGCAWLGYGLSLGDSPAAQRRGLELSAQACDRGALPACDTYELMVAFCQQRPERPACDDLRAQGKLPAPPPPRDDAFGCHRSRGPLDPVGPRVVVCLAEDRISVRDAAGRWDQWRVENWRREDTTTQAIWIVDGIEGPSVTLAALPSDVSASPSQGSAPEPSPMYYVATADGLLQVTLEAARDEEAERRLAALAPVEEVCRYADACESTPLPGSTHEPARTADDDLEAETDDFEPSPVPRTWRHCHQRWSAAAHARLAWRERGTRVPLPPACGTLESDDSWWAAPRPPFATDGQEP